MFGIVFLTNGRCGGRGMGEGWIELSLTEHSSPLVSRSLLLFIAFRFHPKCGNDLTAKLLWIK